MTALWEHSDEISARAEHELVGAAFLSDHRTERRRLIAVPERMHALADPQAVAGGIARSGGGRYGSGDASAIDRSGDQDRDLLSGGARSHARRFGGGDRSRRDGSRRCSRAVVGDGDARARRRRGRAVLVGIAVLRQRLGCPAVYCAPGDIRNCHTFEEHVEVEEYFAGVVGFANFMARYCGVVDETELPKPGKRETERCF